MIARATVARWVWVRVVAAASSLALAGCASSGLDEVPFFASSERTAASELEPGDLRIRLPNRVIDPKEGEVELPADLFPPLSQGAIPVLIQFKRWPDSKERAQARAAGATLRESMGSRAYVVMIERGTTLRAIAALPQFRWAGELLPQDKIAPVLWTAMGERECPGGSCRHRIIVVMRDATRSRAGENVIEGFTPNYRRHGPTGVWALTLETSEIVRLAGDPAVRWIEPLADDEVHFGGR